MSFKNHVLESEVPLVDRAVVQKGVDVVSWSLVSLQEAGKKLLRDLKNAFDIEGNFCFDIKYLVNFSIP